MYSLFVKLSQVVGRNTDFHKENPRKGDLEDFRALPSFTGIRILGTPECSRHSYFPERLKKLVHGIHKTFLALLELGHTFRLLSVHSSLC